MGNKISLSEVSNGNIKCNSSKNHMGKHFWQLGRCSHFRRSTRPQIARNQFKIKGIKVKSLKQSMISSGNNI